MDEWSKLSMADRAKYIKLAIDSGLTDLNHIKTTYNSFARGGYTKWKERIKKHKGINIDEDPTYDYEGFYNSDPDRAWDMLNKDSNAHFTDEFKTSLHPSFSNESQYSGYKNKYNPKGITGGTWIDDYNYQLSNSQFDNDWNTDETLDYFNNNESHPVRLYAPDGSTMLRSVTVTPNNKNALGGRVNKFDGTGNSTINRPRRVDVNRLTPELNRNRAINVAHMSQLQDSLIGRNYPEAQRLAIMATAAQEMDKRGSASKGVGGNGLLGLSKERMPLEYLEPDKTGEQIKYILDDLETIHSDNWNHGGSGGPKIQSAKDGYTQFWNATTPEEATMILNKSYIRPRDREAAWKNRANIATILKSFLTK